MKTLICDGEWCLRRNYNSRTNLVSIKGEHCGGVYGFLQNLGRVINRVMPDRVVVAWDGDMSGKLRHDIYEPYKKDNKSWEIESYYKTEYEIDAEARKKISLNNQKIKLKNYLDGLFIRQVEVDLIEGDDLIALYCHTCEEDEQVIIYSRDQDYYQLINERVSVMRPVDNIILTPDNYKRLIGYNQKNALLLKCFEGDDSDNVDGIRGVKLKTLLKYFPKFADEDYTIDRIISEAVEIYTKKPKLKTLENIIGSRRIIARNKQLMDLHEPMVNDEARNEIDVIHQCVLAKEDGFVDRSVSEVMSEVVKEGYHLLMQNDRQDWQTCFTPYFRMSAKEKEYTKKMINGES